MSDIIMRGNTSIMKAIQQEAKKISEANGIAQPFIPQRNQSVVEGGAANSIRRMNIPSQTEAQINSMFGTGNFVTQDSCQEKSNKGSLKFDLTKSSLERLVDSIELTTTTKEYVNAIQSMFSLYALGYLDSTILDKFSREDLNEIKGILREFRSIIESY